MKIFKTFLLIVGICALIPSGLAAMELDPNEFGDLSADEIENVLQDIEAQKARAEAALTERQRIEDERGTRKPSFKRLSPEFPRIFEE